MKRLYAAGLNEYKRMTTAEVRAAFLLDKLFEAGNANLVYCEVERAVVGGIVPLNSALTLEAGKELASDFFNQRRETGIINVGGTGTVTVDNTVYELAPREAVYIGRGARDIVFNSSSKDNPAKFYLLSYPAHKVCPTVKIDSSNARKVELGSSEESNKRIINQYIHPAVCESCQLVMGITSLASGSVWNTMPAHTHERRTEVYLYFDLDSEDAVFHMMGPAQETRHLCMHNLQAAVSPMWSIHSGCGTRAYSFIWGMGGENQEFTDMDHIKISDLR